MSTLSAVEIPARDRSVASHAAGGTVFAILGAISLSHLLNDSIQSLIPALYPLLQKSYSLSFAQIGMITLAFQLTASLLQPVVGLYTDRHPKPYSLVFGMAASLAGLLLLSVAASFLSVLLASALVGVGSSVFHPESSRVARLASGGRAGLAQSVFQVGGNAGSAIGPLLAAFIVVPLGQHSVALFSLIALLAMLVLGRVGRWYAAQRRAQAGPRPGVQHSALPKPVVVRSILVLLALIFSKFFYMASISSYFTFYLIQRFGLSIPSAQLHLFIFLAAVAAGTMIGGPIGDRFGRRLVIWVSILGVLPFTLALPYADLGWTTVLSVIVGFGLSSAFPAIIVYAQDLLPGRVGMVAGLFFGFAFGMGGLGAAALGVLADRTDITFVYRLCSFLPFIGLLTVLLPQLDNRRDLSPVR